VKEPEPVPPFDSADAAAARYAPGERPRSTPPARLAVSRLTVRRSGREVLRDVALSVGPGEILGVLGPNGAGKSTLFGLLAGLLPAEAGALHLDGRPVDPGARALRAAAGIVFQSSGLDGKLSAEENLRLAAALRRVPRREARARTAALLAGAGLAGRAREPVERLSGGMRRRVELCAALVHAPTLLVMDEPTTGLDAASFRAFWAEVEARRRASGLTVIVATHRPEEAERCDRLVVLAGGRVVADETPESLRARVRGEVVVIEADEPEEIAAELSRRLGLAARVRPDGVHVEREAAHALVPRVVEAFPTGRLRAVSIRRPTLADAYLALTGETLEAEPADPSPVGEGAPPPLREPPAAVHSAPGERPPATPAARDAARLPPVRALALDLATIAVLWRRDLVRFFRQPSRLVGALGQPILFWLVIGTGMSGTFRYGGGTGYLAYFFPGVVLMVVLFAAIFTTLSVIEDRQRGFLQTVLAGPGSRTALVLGKAVGSASVALSQAALFLLLAPAAGFAFGAVHWPQLAAALALAALALAGIGFAVAWVVDSPQGYHAIQMTLLVPLWVLSGAMFPVPADRPALAAIMHANPISYAVSAVRHALAGPGAPGTLPGGAGRDLAACAAFAAGALALAALASRRAPRT
jgi:ABC-2 type transport system ATP-binding protein